MSSRPSRSRSEYNVRLPLCLDVDMSLAVPGLHFGVWRSPLRNRRAGPARSSSAYRLGACLARRHHGLRGADRGRRRQLSRPAREEYAGAPSEGRSVRVDAERRAAVVALTESLCGPLRFVNGGGTGSMATTRAGTRRHRDHGWVGILQPRALRQLPRLPLSTSGGLRHRDRAHPRAGHLHLPGRRLYRLGRRRAKISCQRSICQRARGSIRWRARARCRRRSTIAGQSALALGDPIFMRHAKAGELCERFTHLAAVQDGAIVDERDDLSRRRPVFSLSVEEIVMAERRQRQTDSAGITGPARCVARRARSVTPRSIDELAQTDRPLWPRGTPRARRRRRPLVHAAGADRRCAALAG